MDDAEKAQTVGNLNLALIQLKNAVRLQPTDGNARAQLGLALLRNGELAAAQRELRRAQLDHAPIAIVVPALQGLMLERGQYSELLKEFPEPPQDARDESAADTLGARSVALQALNRATEAQVSIDRALGIRRDGNGLIISAKLAMARGDLALAGSQTDEALKLSPMHEGALGMNIVIARRAGAPQRALANADEFIRRVPGSLAAKALHIELLIEQNQDAKATLEVDALLKAAPNVLYGIYYRGVLLARANDWKAAWIELRKLPSEFFQSEPGVAQMAARVAIASGNAETAGAILTAFIARHPEDRASRLQLASLRLSQNNAKAALDLLEPLNGTNDPSVHAFLGQAYVALGRYDEAIPSLQLTNTAATVNPLLQQQLALLQFQVGDKESGAREIQDLLKSNPSNILLAGPLIVELGRVAKWDEALAVIADMEKQAPTSPWPAFFKGQILLARGNPTAAGLEYGKSLALDPKFIPALYYRANLSVLLGNRDEGKKDLQLIIDQNPSDMLAYIRLTEIILETGDDQAALAVLNRAIKSAPRNVLPQLALASYHIKHTSYQEAQAAVNEALTISPNNSQALLLQAQIQSLRGQMKDAVVTFRRLTAANPASPVAHILLAEALLSTKDQAAAAEAAKEAIALAPKSVEPREELINIEIGEGRGEGALAVARAFASANPGADADILVANVLLRLKRAREAEELLNQSRGAKSDSRIAIRLSQIAARSGNLKKATMILAAWNVKNPNDWETRRQYAELAMSSGDKASALKEYEALLKGHPNDPVVLNNLGWLLQKDDPNRAISLVSLAARIAPQSSEILDSLGWMKVERDDGAGGVALLQRAHNLAPESASISFHLARALDATGKRAEAKSLLQKLVETKSKFEGYDEAAQLLARW